MLNISKWNLFFVCFICLLGAYFLMPNFYGKSEVTALPSFFSKKQVNLGLDLQGGSHLLLEVETKTVLKEESENLVDEIRTFLRKSKIKYTNLGSKVTGAVVTIKDPEKVNFVKKEIRQFINSEIRIDNEDNKVVFSFSEKLILDSRNRTVEQSIEVVRKRVDESGTKEPTIQKQGEERIIVQLPGVKDPERIKTLIGRTAKLNFHMLDPTTVELAEQRGKFPPGTFKAQNSDPTAYEKELRSMLESIRAAEQF